MSRARNFRPKDEVVREDGRLRQCVRVLLLVLAALWGGPAFAQSCNPATTQGTAPAGWQTYCWLDFSTYNDATARTASGQNFAFTLTDGSTLTLTVKTSGTPGINAITAPSWSGAAVGNTAFLGISGKPIFYQNAGGTNTITFSSIAIAPPAGTSAATAYSFVAADAESTNNGESLSFTTNGGAWTLLDQVNPISGSLYPSTSGLGTSSFTETGVAGTVGGYIVGSSSPTTVSTTLVGGGLQGVMFAVRFASIRLNKQIGGARVNAAETSSRHQGHQFRRSSGDRHVERSGAWSVHGSGRLAGIGHPPTRRRGGGGVPFGAAIW
ncbi:MAG: hypothetical protein IPN84_11375 [Sphingomonadales bacterium]|nr:hypothetical protein [Sphingomonadales bacterium]